MGNVQTNSAGSNTASISAGGGVTMNFYGSTHSNAYNEAKSQLSGFLDKTDVKSKEKKSKNGKTILGSLLDKIPKIPKLLDPTVEEMGYSDRLLQLTKGNSTVTTQEAADALVAYGEYPSKHTTGEAIDMETYPGVAVERFYVIGTYEWTNVLAINSYWSFPLPKTIANTGIFGQNLSFHYLYKSGFVVHVQVNASKFHSGCLIACMVPENENTTNTPASTYVPGKQTVQIFKKVNQLPVFPHQYINLRTNNSATIVFPYVNAFPSDFGSHNFVSLVLAVVSPLQYSTGAAPTVCITVSIAPLETSFSGLRNFLSFQGVPVQGVPGSNEFVTTVRNEGIPVYPEFERVEGFKCPGKVDNFLQILQRPTMCTFNDTTPYIKVINQQFSKSPIATIKVGLLDNQVLDTYLAGFARNYCSYRGSLIYNFMFVGTSMATGKFLICYTPAGVPEPTTRADAMLGTTFVWDIGLQSTAHFVVPYMSTTQYRYVNDADSVLGQNGYLTIFYQTALVYPPGNPSESHIVVTLSAGDDFRLRMPFTSNVFQGEVEDGVPALDAIETGVANTNVEGTVQLRPGVPEFSIRETDVEYFYSRYFQIYSEKTNTGLITAPIKFGHKNFKGTKLIETIFNLFTYAKFDLDFVVKVSGPLSDYQVIYSPPHTTPPQSLTDGLWGSALTPSVFSNNWNPPASIRVPYPSAAAYLTSFYDGKLEFNTSASTNYGVNPGNDLGIISVKIAAGKDYTVSIYLRPVNVEMCCPRPIQSYKNVAAMKIRHRPLKEGEGPMAHVMKPSEIPSFDHPMEIMKPNIGHLEIREENGWPNGKYKQWQLETVNIWFDEANPKIKTNCFKTFYPVETHTISSGVFIAKNVMVMPLHCFGPNLTIHTRYSTYRPKILKKVERPNQDLVFLTLNFHSSYMQVGVGMPDPMDSQILHVSPLVGEHSNTAHSPVYMHAIYTTKMVSNLIETNNLSQRGFCGSILISAGKVYGIQVAGDDTHSDFAIITQIMSGNVARREAHGLRQKHGIRDYFVSMGDGIGEGMKKQLEDLISSFENRAVGAVERSVLNKCLKLLVKTISSLCIVANSKDVMASSVALAAIFSIDFVSVDPLFYLKRKISELLHFEKEVQPQGPVDWLKDFNVACNAAKGLDWIWKQLSVFIEWFQDKVKVEGPRRQRFNQLLSEWPEMMEEMDLVTLNRGKYTEESVVELCNKVTELKQLCDVYGVERSFSIGQVLKYNQLAMKWMSNLGKSRIEPVAVLIHGGPGQGKSIATELIAKAICKKLNAQLPYSLPPDPKHFDGYTQQEVVIMDDVCQNPDGEDIKLLCQMISTTQFIPPMASLEEKGMPYTSKFFLASTNQHKLRPITVSEPKALDRRFFLDLTIELQDGYKKDDGTLNFPAAVKRCKHESNNFSCCMPIVCGEAILLVDKNKEEYTIDEIVTMMLQEEDRRSSCLGSLEALFQGRLQMVKKENKGPLAREVLDCIRSIGDDAIIAHFVNEGYIIPDDYLKEIERKKIKNYLDYSLSIGSAIAIVASISVSLYLIYKIFASRQGPYSGSTNEKLKRPTPREVITVQGPNEFNTKLMKDSLYDFETDVGHFTAIGLCDHWFLVPSHSEPGDTVNLNGKQINVLEKKDLQVEKGLTEITVVKLDTPERTRDIRKFIPEKLTSYKQSWLLVNNANFPRMMFPTGNVTPYGMIALSGNFRQNVVQYPYPTRSGQCGGVVTAENKLVAMHIGGDGLNGYGAALKRSYFDFLNVSQGEIVKIEKSDTTINVNTKTQIRPSVFYGVFPGKKEPAVLSKFDKRCEVDFDDTLFQKYKGNKEISKTENMQLAVKQYVSQLKPLMPTNLCERMSLDEVVDGVEGLEALDLTTSAGFPYVTMGIKKKDLIPERFCDKTDLKKVLDKYGIFLPYTTYLKDELRSIEKVKAGKTRLIEASSLNDTIHARQVFGRLFQVFHTNPGVVTGSAVGCNPDTDWTSFYNMLGVENICEFDYSNYDASLHPVWFDLLKDVLLGLGYSEDDCKIIDHMCNSTHLFRNIIYEVAGGMPSGCSGTSVFNSIINNLIVKTLILDSYKGVNLDFVRIIAYGDDVLVSYPFPLEPGLLAVAGQRYGLTMTPADKQGEFRVKTIYEVTFLKRKFVPDEEFPFLIHPVFPLEEIQESIRWTKNASATQEHVYSLLSLLWHSGRSNYEEFIEKCRTIRIGMALHYFDYDVLRRQWLDKF
ncbi:polyprotein [diresapivirus B1]|uniref:Genome polyprotein n=1 Tax=diresapivirus B1 TaxID=2849729 RepID=A0A0D3MDA4_9PICO|nr:polyprotein [Bat picornavirus]AIF74261.1 polyprotein [diresapivirus B1]